MNLPNAHLAFLEREKIVDYLLNPIHRYGASKARFFLSFGFRAENWEQLESALLVHARRDEVARIKESCFGVRYEIEGLIEAPDGRRPRLRTVWQVDEGKVAPRLITAYPLELL